MNYQMNNPFSITQNKDEKIHINNLPCDNQECNKAGKFIDIESHLKMYYTKTRSRANLDIIDYVPSGNHVDKGFNNLDIANFLYYSQNTRSENVGVRELDLFKFEEPLYNWPNKIEWRDIIPKDTRYLNHSW